MLPKIKFQQMSLEENINIVKWIFFDNDEFLELRNYTLERFPKLKDLDKNLTKPEIYKKIEEVVSYDYKKYEQQIKEEIIRYDSIWSKYNNDYMNSISNYLNIDWPKNIKIINASVGLLPVSPRDLDTFSFSTSVGIEENYFIETCAHEILHFIWFEKWKQLYPECTRREYDSPNIPWQYSEMVIDPILNSNEIKPILKIKAKSYDSFYNLIDEEIPVMDNLISIYNESLPIEEKIIKGYEYISDYIKLKKSKKI